jgi:hypothetical protein
MRNMMRECHDVRTVNIEKARAKTAAEKREKTERGGTHLP